MCRLQGETDILGNLYKSPDQPLTAKAFELVKVVSVGGYAIQPVWADGHNTGIYSFDYLRRVAAAKEKRRAGFGAPFVMTKMARGE